MARSLSLPVWLVLSVLLGGCDPETPGFTETSPVTFAKGGGQTLYTVTFSGDMLPGSAAFSALAKTGDPFLGIGGENVTLILPAYTTGNTAVCGVGTSNSWGDYAGEWRGTLNISRKRGQIHVSYVASPADGSPGFLNLDARAPDDDSNALTVTLSDALGLVGATSTPDGTNFDPQDRCLNLVITATP